MEAVSFAQIWLMCLVHFSLTVLCWSLVSPNTTGLCYTTDPAPYRHYSTKTLYEDVRGTDPVQRQSVQGERACWSPLWWFVGLCVSWGHTMSRNSTRLFDSSVRQFNLMGHFKPCDLLVSMFTKHTKPVCFLGCARLYSTTLSASHMHIT